MDFWSFFWLLVWSFFFVAYLMMLFQIFGDIFRDEELGGFAKVVWVSCSFVFPLIAALVYIIVRGKGMAERAMKSNAADGRAGGVHPQCRCAVVGPGSSSSPRPSRCSTPVRSRLRSSRDQGPGPCVSPVAGTGPPAGRCRRP